MLELIAAGKCDGCPRITPTVNYLYFDDGTVREVQVDCKNRPICDRLEAYLIDVIKREYQGEE